ncbi:MAG TPA: DUF6398 domain-containing protein [Methylomusa anaerophila]|uniref:DUF6398 domain-containing protein n=1 Tax=Methylomusa anaerophila TaxID=1930071 RepID=A0A348ANF3_9FIRM|nr:DUF6398 domain-containing protein [Methylomusa anaerophila]BBB92601.1 hypothetical protein MAMMFC1_03296 [Methylomusa anaerophila]HML87545.1 DUF6398 domain-containing protein [Methylomusa anaerophila]
MTNNNPDEIKNVYDEVHLFFEQELECPAVLKREWVEGFLRQKAWQGVQDESLRDIWRNLQMFILYMSYSGDSDIEDIGVSEYSLAIEWMIVQIEGFKADIKTVRHFFEVLQDFYLFLAGRKMLTDSGELKKAAEYMTGGKKLRFYDSAEHLEQLDDDINNKFARNRLIVPEEIGRIVGEAVERLMLKFSSYFQQDGFVDDFDRALMLYLGPMVQIPDRDEENDDDFWLGFWDYFLFDYHLLANDLTPLNKFKEAYADRLSTEERKILSELMSARFTVFYIESIINQDWVECVNLLTDERFRLPNPNFDYKVSKKMLFFGHIFFQEREQELVMINFITSVEISTNLRRRIKEEIARQKAIFDIQKPGASWSEFLERHANAIRHTIDLLATWAKVNVTPYTHIEHTFPKIEEKCRPNLAVSQVIAGFMPKLSYSHHDVMLAQQLWDDFSQLTCVTVRKPEVWAAAVIYAYSQINSSEAGVSLDILAEELGVSKSGVSQNRNRIADILELKPFDPRYLSEEGLIHLLYSS